MHRYCNESNFLFLWKRFDRELMDAYVMADTFYLLIVDFFKLLLVVSLQFFLTIRRG
jgi:hypothetical protein